MRTLAEIAPDGRIVRVFHRTPTAAWTHRPGEKGRYWGGRHGSGRWLEMACSCSESLPRPSDARSDAEEAGERPTPVPATGILLSAAARRSA